MDGASAAMRCGGRPGEDADLSDFISSSQFEDVPFCSLSIYEAPQPNGFWKPAGKNDPQDYFLKTKRSFGFLPTLIHSLLFFFCFFVAGAHYMLWFTLVQLCFHGSCSTNHRVWLFTERPNSFTSARNSAPFHSSAL